MDVIKRRFFNDTVDTRAVVLICYTFGLQNIPLLHMKYAGIDPR